MGMVPTKPLPPGGSPPLQSGGQNQKWPTCGQGGYITPAAWGIPSASERGAESEVAHKWLHNPIGRLWRRGAYGARRLLGLIPLTTNYWPEAPGGEEG